MVAFKGEFPYLRCESGQLFEFDRDWLHAAITRAADQAGYPSWWLTDHVTESIAFYLRLRTDESVVAFSQLSQTVRYVLKVIGYKEIVPYFEPAPPPISISLLEIAEAGRRGIRAGVFRSSGKKDQRACWNRYRQLASSRAAAVRQTFAGRKSVVARVRSLARGSGLFCPGKTGGNCRLAGNDLLHSLGASAQ